MSYYESGTLLSFNKEGEVCGGKKQLFACETVKELVKTVVTVDTTHDTVLTDSWHGNGNTSMLCQSCSKSCGVSVHVVNKRATEELCFTFTDIEPVDTTIVDPESEEE
jgi:hypothetical protein